MAATDNKIALITGASKRLGAAMARRFHQQDIDVIIHYHRSAEAAENLAEALNQQRKNSAFTLAADLNEPQQVIELARQAAAIRHRLDILINNASTYHPTPIANAELQHWQTLFASNAQAPFFLCQQLAPLLKQQQGCIINMVDIYARRPKLEHSIYCMAKASLVAMTQALAKEMAPEIRVNGIAPGAILWPENASEQTKAAILEEIPLQRIGSEADIADTAYFLSQAGYITGQIIAVDGGKSL